MAAGFKTATVNASDVPSSQSNYPAYVDLSRLGITTLAEAQSVRVYADSSKTTEWAREIVSASEMWVKIPSLTSTTSIYVDYDGVRSDYAVTDTYGRNAVWSGWGAVWHLSESSGNATDSTGNGNTGTSTSTTNTSAIVKNGGVFNGSAFYTITDNSTIEPTNAITVGGWLYISSTSSYQMALAKGENAGDTRSYEIRTFGTTTQIEMQGHVGGGSYIQARTTSGIGTNTWAHVYYARNGTSQAIYVNGVSASLATNITSASNFDYSTDNLWLGQRNGGLRWNGRQDEMRLIGSQLSANWITTEYNNQSDEAGFWGTWSDVGGGGNTTDFFIMA